LTTSLSAGESVSIRGVWPVLLLAVAGGCTAPRAVAPVDEGELTELRLKTGDEIRVVTRQRQRMSFEITELRPSEMVGVTRKPAPHETLPKGTSVTVPYDDLAFVVVNRFSAARTAAAPLLVLGLAAGYVLTVTPPVAMAGP
jgi:hypothetical protein